MGQDNINLAFMGEENIGYGIIKTLLFETNMCKKYKQTLEGWYYLDVDFIEQNNVVKKVDIKILNSNNSSMLQSFSEKNSESKSHLCLIIDGTNKEQFNSLKAAFQQVKKYFQNFTKTLIVKKKTPDVDAEVTENEIYKLVEEYKASIFVLERIDGESVEHLFKHIRLKILEQKGKRSGCC